MARPNALPTEKNETAAAAPKFKVKKLVTLPLLKLDVGTPVFIQFLEPLKIGKQVEEDKDAAILTNVVNLTTGEPCQFLVPAVLQGILHDDYGAPKFGTKTKGGPVEILEPADPTQTPDSYVGKQFMVLKKPKVEGKRYFPFEVAEIEVE